MKNGRRTADYEGSRWTLDRNENRLRLMRDDVAVWWGTAPIPNDLDIPLAVLLELSIDQT